MQAGAQSVAVEAELKALRAESSRSREEKLAKEKELTEVKLELATLRRTSEVSAEAMKAGILSQVLHDPPRYTCNISFIKPRNNSAQEREINIGAGDPVFTCLQIDS